MPSTRPPSTALGSGSCIRNVVIPAHIRYRFSRLCACCLVAIDRRGLDSVGSVVWGAFDVWGCRKDVFEARNRDKMVCVVCEESIAVAWSFR